MTVRDVAGYLNVDEKTVYRLVSRGKLPGFKVAGAWRFLAEDVDAWIEKQKREVGGHLSRGPAGTEVDEEDRMTFESHNPATGELVGTYPEHDEAETILTTLTINGEQR
jgi:excisionase family DNA binding protein